MPKHPHKLKKKREEGQVCSPSSQWLLRHLGVFKLESNAFLKDLGWCLAQLTGEKSCITYILLFEKHRFFDVN